MFGLALDLILEARHAMVKFIKDKTKSCVYGETSLVGGLIFGLVFRRMRVRNLNRFNAKVNLD